MDDLHLAVRQFQNVNLRAQALTKAGGVATQGLALRWRMRNCAAWYASFTAAAETYMDLSKPEWD